MTVESNFAIAIATSKVIGLKISRQFFNQWEAKQKAVAASSCTRDFSRSLNKWQVIVRNSDRLIALFARVLIGRSDYFVIGFSTVIWKPLQYHTWFHWWTWFTHG